MILFSRKFIIGGKNYFQKGLSIIILSVLFFLTPLGFIANAASFGEYPTNAEYDLSIGDTQTFTIRDLNNNLINVVISEEQSVERLEDRTYSVTFNSPLAWRAGFKINIENNSIISVHSSWHEVIRGKISSARLIKDHSKQATYRFVYSYLSSAISTGVRASISGTTLKAFAI